MPFEIKDAEALRTFALERVLNEDPITHTITLLGAFAGETAIVRLEKTALGRDFAERLFGPAGQLVRAEQVEGTDIYTWFLGWFGEQRERDVKINVICPATEVHIRKYSAQELVMVRETPEMYASVVLPYIEAFPAARTQWVEEILAGRAEADKVLYTDEEFVLLPDMKWDLTTVSALYLMAITRVRGLRSLRDLRGTHLGMLRRIQDEAERAVGKWGIGRGEVRLFVHYQPSYYHFHVHVVNVNATTGGMAVGQAHLLDDVISMLELDGEVFRKMTLTYALGREHALSRSRGG